MGRRVFEFGDFSGGDFGRLEAWRAPKNTWTGTNMLVYRTGELGVRPGLRDVSPSGQSNGTIWGIGQRPGTPGDVWYGQGTAIKYFTPQTTPGAVSTATNSLSGTPVARVAMDEGGTTTYLATTTENGYSFNGATLTGLSSMPDAQAIAVYGDRIVIVPTSATNTLRYSAAADPTSWPVANTITVGDSDPITAIFTQRGHLAILKKSSQFYILTGVPGVNDTLRPVTRFDGPKSSWNAGRSRASETIWFGSTNSQHLAGFDGSRAVPDYNIPLPLYVGLADVSVQPLHDDDPSGFVVVSNANSGVGTAAQAWVNYKHAWSKHTFGVDVTNYATVAFHGYAQDGDSDVDRLRYGTMLVFSDGGGASATPKFYSWQPFMDRPGLEADPFTASAERAGDASATPVSGSVTFPEQRTDDGSELQVRGVLVDFRSWDTGSATNNHFDLTVKSLRSYETPGPVDSTTLSFDEAASLSSTAGTVRRKYFGFGDTGRSGGFQLSFENIKGIAFQRIQVVTETFPARQ